MVLDDYNPSIGQRGSEAGEQLCASDQPGLLIETLFKTTIKLCNNNKKQKQKNKKTKTKQNKTKMLNIKMQLQYSQFFLNTQVRRASHNPNFVVTNNTSNILNEKWLQYVEETLRTYNLQS